MHTFMTSPLAGLSSAEQANALPAMKRILFLAIGVLFVLLGLVGVFLPGIPTTGPLIAASFFLTRSNPRLERRLLRLKLFRHSAPYLYGAAPLPRRARICALSWMWVSILSSCVYLTATARVGLFVILAILALGLIGSVVIIRFRREAASPERIALDGPAVDESPGNDSHGIDSLHGPCSVRSPKLSVGSVQPSCSNRIAPLLDRNAVSEQLILH